MESTFHQLKNKRARDAYVEAELLNGIAAQIRVLRQQRGWSQKELAAKLGTSQGVVSRLEDPSYGRFSLKTLLHLGSIFDVFLVTRFLPFSQAVPATWGTKPEALEADAFDAEVENIKFYSKVSENFIHKYERSITAVENMKLYNSKEVDSAKPNFFATCDLSRVEIVDKMGARETNISGVVHG